MSNPPETKPSVKDPSLTDDHAGWDRIIVVSDDPVTHIRFADGKIDGTSVRELYEFMIQLFDRHGAKFLIDFSKAEFMNSGMLGMLATVKKKALQSGSQVLVAIPNPMLREQFEVVQMHRLLGTYADPQAALSAFKP